MPTTRTAPQARRRNLANAKNSDSCRERRLGRLNHAKITALAWQPIMARCLQAGAAEVLDGAKHPFASLGPTFDATLNFATWDDDLALVRCLRNGALGRATTSASNIR